MTANTPTTAPDVDVATAVAQAAEDRAVQAAEDADQARLDALDAARRVAAARQAEADQAAADLRQREADWADTLARKEAEAAAERLEAERERLVALRAEIAGARQALEAELPDLLDRTHRLAHAWAQWETRRGDLRGRPNQLVQTAAQVLGDASVVAMAAFGIESDSFGAMAGTRDVPHVVQEAIIRLFIAAQGTKPPAEPQ